MPDFPVKNQYRGINAHLHSFWQAEGKWNRFHYSFMTDLYRQVQHLLMPIDYTSHLEWSIQLQRVDDSIYAPQDNPLSDKYYRSPAIYRLRDEKKPVVWIELLSPGNSCAGQDRDIYIERRTKLQYRRNLRLIELDFVNDLPPEHAGEPPYHIRFFRSHSDISTLKFDIDTPVPTVTLSLSDAVSVEVDFDAAYQQMFERLLYGYDVDYSQFPVNFERYSPADQARIARRMLAILKAKQAGVDLETAPLPVEEHLTLDEAKAQIEAMKS